MGGVAFALGSAVAGFLDFMAPQRRVQRELDATKRRFARLQRQHERLFELTDEINEAIRSHKPRRHLMAERIEVRTAILRGG